MLRFALGKTLENIPRPLYKAAAFSGEATAMRQNQCFLCLCESITLSITFQLCLLHFLVIFGVFQDNSYVATAYPMKNILWSIGFVFNTIIQDFVCGNIFRKFSNWSFVYFGMFSQRYFPFILLGCVGCLYTNYLFIIDSRAKATMSAGFSIDYSNYGSPFGSASGYGNTQN